MKETDWTFAGTWPYKPRWYETPGGKMHYIDEGPQDHPAVVLLHGNPAWSFLYRHFIPALLAANLRVIAVDHLGFGRSDKPGDSEAYDVGKHTERLEALLDTLNPHDVTLVCHDWGGPIGLLWAVRHPHIVSRLFIFNTIGQRPTGAVPLTPPVKIMRSPMIGDVLIKGLNMFTKVFMFKLGVTHKEHLTKLVHEAYLAPHPTWQSRSAVLAFPRQIPTGPTGPVADMLGEIEQGLRTSFRQKPVRIVWGMKDITFGPQVLKNWQKLLPQAATTTIADAGHFVQEDAYEIAVPLLVAFATGKDK